MELKELKAVMLPMGNHQLASVYTVSGKKWDQ